MYTIEKIHFASINSTNTWAKDNINTFKPNTIYFVTTDTQTGGKGSKDRSWSSPKGGFYCTICFPNINKLNPNTITLVTAITICSLFEKKEINLQIKWPNDIICNNKKIGGILSELHDDWFIVGIGLNINLEKEHIMKIKRPLFPASSLKLEGYNDLVCNEILNDLINIFPKNLKQWEDTGLLHFMSEFNKFNILINKIIHIKNMDKDIHGAYLKLGINGELIISNATEIETFLNGDILKIT